MAISNASLKFVNKDVNENTNVSDVADDFIINGNLSKANLLPGKEASAIIINKQNDGKSKISKLIKR